MDPISEFREAIGRAGLTPPAEIIADGELHRFASNGKRGDLAGWYVLHLDGIPAGAFGCWRLDVYQTWCAKPERELTAAERAQQLERIEAAQRKREEAEREQRDQARRRAASEWSSARPAPDSHPYLARKGVKAHGLRVTGDGRLVVPVRDASGELHSLQFIGPDGDKRFLPAGRVRGCYFGIGKPRGVLCVAEGYATATTIHEATGHAVAVAFNAGNLEPVARALREKLPDVRLILCADDDVATADNPGITKATEAARAVGGFVAVPAFGPNRPERVTDFNDLAAHRGPEAVRAYIEDAKAPDALAWPDPLPLIADTVAAPYPVDALPGAIGEAVREVAAFVQCPVALAACSALSVLSAAAQGLANVRRGPDLQGPVSLYLLAVAESGERKSECDKRFSEPLRHWEAEKREAVQPDLERYRAELGAWEAEREAILQRIKQAVKEGKSAHEARADLVRLEGEKPAPVREPRLLLESETAESLAWNLARADGWPCGGILSAEAGIVFGGHSMRRDNIVNTLSLCNKLWSGEPYRVSRRTSESFDLQGARLTMGLAVQPGTIQAFFEDARGLARETGFAARFLIAWPESTQGTRLYRDAPDGWPGLNAFHAWLRALLGEALPFNECRHLAPPALELDREAFDAWRQFHDDAERELRNGGELADVRDVASKAAENVARVAALFHLATHGLAGRIGADHVAAAARIVTWHLFEARRFLVGLALPKILSNAVKLDAWLVAQCRERGAESVSARDVLCLGPNPVRRKVDRDAALAELIERERVCLEDAGRTIRINPALLGS